MEALLKSDAGGLFGVGARSLDLYLYTTMKQFESILKTTPIVLITACPGMVLTSAG